MATEVKKPTDFTEDASLLWTDEALAYDQAGGGDETTHAYAAPAGDVAPSITWHTWGTKGQTYSATVLKVKWDCVLLTGDDHWGIEYTKDGSTWNDLLADGLNRSASIVTTEIALDNNQDLTLVQIRLSIVQEKGADGHTIRIYDVWTEGEYTEAVEDLDVADPFEAVAISEDVELIVGTIVVPEKFDTVNVLEDVDVEVASAVEDLDIDEFELISLTEYIETLGDSLLVDLFDTVDAAEDITAELAHEFVLSLSDEFVDGAATTFQLDPPATKDTGDFIAGKIHESSNPADSIDITADDYTELEFCFQATEAAGEVSYDFRIEGLDTYTVTPQLTVGAGGETLEVNVHDCAKTKTCLV